MEYAEYKVCRCWFPKKVWVRIRSQRYPNLLAHDIQKCVKCNGIDPSSRTEAFIVDEALIAKIVSQQSSIV